MFASYSKFWEQYHFSGFFSSKLWTRAVLNGTRAIEQKETIEMTEFGTRPFRLQSPISPWHLLWLMEIKGSIATTPSVINYNSFDFFYLKFDHSHYLKKLCKHSQIEVILEEYVLIKQTTIKKVIFCIIFWIRWVVQLGVKRVKLIIVWNGGSNKWWIEKTYIQ